jgi:hypothetical protein
MAHLLRWDAATQGASGDAARYLQAARRRAEVALAGLPTGSGDDPLLHQAAGLTSQIAALQEPGGIAELARQLALVPLPLRVINEARGWSYPPPTADEDGRPAAPAVGICRLDGVLVTNAHVLRPDEVHDLGLEIRLTQWPDQATALEVTFLSVLSPDQARLPSFAFPRVPPDEDGIWRLSGSGSLSVSFTLPAGAPPLAFPVAARFTGPGLDEVLPVAGHSELRLRPFDATTDGLTRRPQLDERLADMYTVLHGKNLNADDVQAFCRLYTAIAAKAVDIQYERSYMRKHGGGVTERSFHDDLFGRLLADPVLEGRVQRGTRAAAGFLDIAHDRINAELKVSKKTPVTIETSHKYLGQAADYAADIGSQLSILVVLDMSLTKNPPGVLENYLGFMEPELAGLRDPRFPSLVGVTVIKGSLLIPSGYSGGLAGRRRRSSRSPRLMPHFGKLRRRPGPARPGLPAGRGRRRPGDLPQPAGPVRLRLHDLGDLRAVPDGGQDGQAQPVAGQHPCLPPLVGGEDAGLVPGRVRDDVPHLHDHAEAVPGLRPAGCEPVPHAGQVAEVSRHRSLGVSWRLWQPSQLPAATRPSRQRHGTPQRRRGARAAWKGDAARSCCSGRGRRGLRRPPARAVRATS